MLKLAQISALSLVTLLSVSTVAAAGPIQNRLDRQDQRISQGVQSGDLTYAEYQRLQNRQDRIEDFRQRQIQDGNGLNPVEFLRINHRLNRQSRQIYRQKHD
ncbi:hypothetical protein [Lyngbya confervoides]|uniref:Uncharacterized protein n=1 Tax=Lyngbya confervoides BDU141951 TaxID=1574623 RepID=A0ABD4T0A5_9CYAN|nr:hypothetical protein [Lyngbya confervoides]MCM1981868.1 hypothetical protein [Lyngbya confervoides BDU141951]